MSESLFDNTIWDCYLESRISNESFNICRFAEKVVALLPQRGWTEENLFGVQLSIEEALMNAAQHGNKFSPNKKITVRCGINSELLGIEIIDEGLGFSVNNVPNPLSPEKMRKPNGRGVLLIKRFMDRVEYLPPGNQVYMEKRKV